MREKKTIKSISISISLLSNYISIPNNKEAKFQAPFFVHLFFVFLFLTNEQWRVSFIWTYIYNSCSYELE
jgi:hypothetical protein